jgi:hypothetical protein
MTLTEFLAARLDEDQAAAEALKVERWVLDNEWVFGETSADVIASLNNDQLSTATGEHIARHDPARVLAEVDAKRRILELHADGHECPTFDREIGGEPVTGYYGDDCPTLRRLALPHADHPDYDPEWQPRS